MIVPNRICKFLGQLINIVLHISGISKCFILKIILERIFIHVRIRIISKECHKEKCYAWKVVFICDLVLGNWEF
jgi:hypothetical protein